MQASVMTLWAGKKGLDLERNARVVSMVQMTQCVTEMMLCGSLESNSFPALSPHQHEHPLKTKGL